jgi:hypothetical protein
LAKYPAGQGATHFGYDAFISYKNASFAPLIVQDEQLSDFQAQVLHLLLH